MILSRIPHIYHNTIYSRKIFEIAENKHLKFRKIYEDISNFNDVDKSRGYFLDILGKNFEIDRLGKNDEEYKKELKFLISSLTFMGSPEEIKNILALYFNINKEQFFIYELSGKIIINIPDTIKKDDVIKAVKKIKTAGIGLQVDFEVYIEDYTIAELEEMTLVQIEKITLARG